jgi:predicted ATPase/DNA-binding SARP family transcriptional activator
MRDSEVSSAVFVPRTRIWHQTGSARAWACRYGAWRRARRRRQRTTTAIAPAPAQVASLPALRVRTLGAFEVTCGGRTLGATAWNEHKVTSLFKILLTAPGHRLSRERLIAALWPEDPSPDPDKARSRLAYTTSRLRDVLQYAGPFPSIASARQSYLRREGDDLVLDPSPQMAAPADWLDATHFEQLTAHALSSGDPAACRRALAAYRGDYLPDDRYAEWTRARRQTLAARYIALLRCLATACQFQDPEEAVRALRAILYRDPCDETAAEALMRIYVRQGQRTQALRVYLALADVTRRRVGAPPSEGLTQFYQLLAGPATPVPQPPAMLNTLPNPLTSFIGRAAEQRALLRLVLDTRLLTLTGEGGCGKTRLALAVAQAIRAAFPGGVWWVELAGLPQGSVDLLPSVARVLGVRERPGEPVLATVIAFLREARTLVILDNCEHVRLAAAQLAGQLLAAGASVRVLATSREPLGMQGERRWPLDPLPLPALASDVLADGDLDESTVDAILRSDAVRLFADRARQVVPAFDLERGTAGIVARICRRLDGLPLAIELAAARLADLTLGELAARLDQALALLQSGNAGAPPRQQTLEAALAWSYTLLPPAEQTLWRRLSVFRGGCTLEAARAVCGGAELAAAAIPDLLRSLCARSVVRCQMAAGEERFTLLEPVRQYGAARLNLSS